MPLDSEVGKKMLQLVTSRFDQREWRKKIEKILSLPPSGVEDEKQQALFLYLKHRLKAYKSRRADPDSWIVGGYATREVIERAKYNPKEVGAGITAEDVAFLGVDPGAEVDAPWWEEMLVLWFETPESEEEAAEESPSGTPEEVPSASDKESKSSRP